MPLTIAVTKLQTGRGERIRTSGLYVPNVALYQAKLHPVRPVGMPLKTSDQPIEPIILAEPSKLLRSARPK